MGDDSREPDKDEPTEPPTDGPVIQVSDWFRDRREVWLELDGVRYRLRVTRGTSSSCRSSGAVG